MKTPKMTPLDKPELIKAAQQLELGGKLALTDTGLLYLDIDNRFIHSLHPLLRDEQINIPDYFGENDAGAHVSVIYPEETESIQADCLGQVYSFKLKDLVLAEFPEKKYHVLLVDSPSLLEVRRMHHLAELLLFKEYAIGFHITLGWQVNNPLKFDL